MKKHSSIAALFVLLPALVFGGYINGGGGGGAGTWGSITGTISSQTDLVSRYGGCFTDNGNAGSAKTINLATCPMQGVTLNSASSILTLSNPNIGTTYLLWVQQDSTGGRSVIWPSSVGWLQNTPPTLSGANKLDQISLTYNGTFFIGSYGQGISIPYSGFTPTDIAGIQLWFDGTDTSTMNTGSGITDGTALSTWRDKSGNNRTGTQSTSGLRPVYNTNLVNGRGAVTFASSAIAIDDTVAFLDGASAWTAVFILKFSSFSSSNNFFFTSHSSTVHRPVIGVDATGGILEFVGNGGSEWAAQSWTAALDTTNFHSLIVQYNGSGVTSNANLNAFLDGTALSTNASTVVAFGTGANVGSPDGTSEPNFMLQGPIADVIIYNSKLNSTQLNNLASWINHEYGI